MADIIGQIEQGRQDCAGKDMEDRNGRLLSATYLFSKDWKPWLAWIRNRLRNSCCPPSAGRTAYRRSAGVEMDTAFHFPLESKYLKYIL
jgi:hypothetical protein